MAVYLGYLVLAGIQALFFYNWNGLRKRQFNIQADRGPFEKSPFNMHPYLLLCCIELILLTGLRGYTIGADTSLYLDALRHFRSLPLWEIPLAPLVFPFDFEIGYFALTKACAFLGMNETVFLFVIAMITYIPVFVAIQKHSKIPYLSILSYFAFGMFSYSLGVFRQMIAVSILLCGWKYVKERKLIPYLLVVGLAMTFHMTSIIAILLYILYGIHWKKIMWFILPTEVLLLIFGRYVVILATKIMPPFEHYLGGMYDQQGGSYLMLILLNIVLLVCIILNKQGRFNNDMTICALILAVFLQSVGYSMALFGRIVLFFSIYLIFAIPNAVYGLGEKWRKPAGIVAIAMLFFLSFMMISGNQYIVPYYAFFQEAPIT